MPKLSNDLTGKVEKYEELFEALERMSPVPIHFETIKSSTTKGYYDQDAKLIVIKDGMSEMQNIKTAIHEIAHAKLHDRDLEIDDESKRPNSRTREVEAESIAYTVCLNYGIDTSDYSFGYIAGWSQDKELPELKTSLGVFRKEVNTIIHDVDWKLSELRKEKDEILAQKVDTEIEEKKQLKLEIQEKEEVIQEILAEIRRTEPDYDSKVLSTFENDLRKMTIEEMHANEYTNHFLEKDVSNPNEPTKTNENQRNEPTKTNDTEQVKKPKSNETQQKTPKNKDKQQDSTLNNKNQQKTTQKSNNSAQKKTGTQKSAPKKTTAPAKTGIRANLDAARKEAATRNQSTPKKTKETELSR